MCGCGRPVRTGLSVARMARRCACVAESPHRPLLPIIPVCERRKAERRSRVYRAAAIASHRDAMAYRRELACTSPRRNDSGMVRIVVTPTCATARAHASRTLPAMRTRLRRRPTAPVLFKVQTYRTHLADVALDGGPTRQLTTFQSETPSYHPTRPLIAFTYGTWRRVIDDAKYPDIAQEIGVIDVTRPCRPTKPLEVIAQSDSEDQAMAWSPNGKWIAFHTHREMSDDVWLRPTVAESAKVSSRTSASRSSAAARKSAGRAGRPTASRAARWRAQERRPIGALRDRRRSGHRRRDLGAARSAAPKAFDGEMGHAEWLPAAATVIAVAKEGPGRHVIFTLPVAGGTRDDRASLRDRARFLGSRRLDRRHASWRLPRRRPTASTRSSEGDRRRRRRCS